MAELLLNWAVLLATFAALILIAWWGFRDLQGQFKVQGSRFKEPLHPTLNFEPGTLNSDEAPEAVRRLKVEYQHGGEVRHVHWVTDEKPGFIGTEELPGMGSGILVRHVRIFHEGNEFKLENRHSSRPLPWWVENHHHGEVPPGGVISIGREMALTLGEWRVVCSEER